MNRLQKVLDGANIKLASVAADIFGQSSWAMLEVLILGGEDPKTLSDLVQRRLKRKKDNLNWDTEGLSRDPSKDDAGNPAVLY